MLVSLALLTALTASGLAQQSVSSETGRAKHRKGCSKINKTGEKFQDFADNFPHLDLAEFLAILTECKITNQSTMSWEDKIQCQVGLVLSPTTAQIC